MGNSIPAILEVKKALGPEALTIVPHEISSPVERIILSTLFLKLFKDIETTSLCKYSTLFFFADFLHHSNIMLPSKYPSSLIL